jgi:hypothetical protein
MHPQLKEIEGELESATARVEQLGEQWSEESWRKRPADGGWSAVECIAHLNLTSRSYLPLLDEALASRGQQGATPARMRKDLIGWLIWKAVRPDTKMKAKTAPAFVPQADGTVASVLSDFRDLQGALIERLRAADGRPLHRIKVASPFNDRVRYSVYSGFSILSAHEHRHIDQAERALKASN